MFRVIRIDARKLDLAKAVPKLRLEMRNAGEQLAGELKEYPRQITGRKQPPKTPRQAAFLRWAISTGLIQVPYRRTGHLGHSWFIKGPYLKGHALRVDVASDPSLASYNLWVQSDRFQTKFHREGGWPTPQGVIEKVGKKVISRLEKVFKGALR